jgi:capsular polysaccharide biosynthesis protein
MFNLLKKHSTLIIVWGLAFLTISIFASLFFPRQYSATSQVLIISRDKSGVDPYTQARSAEKVGANLTQIINTTDFLNKVMNNENYVFDRAPWNNLAERQKRKKWNRDVQANMLYGVSIMNIKVYSYTQRETLALSNAITQTMVTQGWEYLGGDVAIKSVSDPLVSRWPTRPNVAANAGIGFLVGVLISSLWVLRYRKHTLFG